MRQQARAQVRDGALDAALHGLSWEAQPGGDLAETQPFAVTQPECEAVGFAQGRQLRSEQVVALLVVRRIVGRVAQVLGAAMAISDPTLAAAQLMAAVDHDPAEPGPGAGAGLERRGALVGEDEGALGRVLGIAAVAGQAHGQAEGALGMEADEEVERLAVTRGMAGQQMGPILVGAVGGVPRGLTGRAAEGHGASS